MTLNDPEWIEWPFCVKFSLLRTDFYSIIYLIFNVESVHIHVTVGDVGIGVADRDQQNIIWNPRKNCGSFVNASSSEPEQIRPTLVFSTNFFH